MRVLRAALQRRGLASRVTLLGAGVVIVVIAGILAMHSLSLEDDQIVAVVPAESASLTVEVAPMNSTDIAPGCEAAMCSPNDAASAIACVLALLLTLSLLTPLRRSRWDDFITLLRRRLSPTSEWRSAQLPTGPSLVTLSISRT